MSDSPEIMRLRAAHAIVVGQYEQEVFRLRDVIEALRRALHDIAEEWAGAECGKPVYAQEAYAIGLAQRMARIAHETLGNHT